MALFYYPRCRSDSLYGSQLVFLGRALALVALVALVAKLADL
jgi:hypothetical protein